MTEFFDRQAEVIYKAIDYQLKQCRELAQAKPV